MDYNRELNEAIVAGERAKESLEDALDVLNSARNWGLWDMFGGGGLITSLIKHSKMEKASDLIEDAKENLRQFGKELGDIEEYADVDLSTGDFWGFADWFFDGFFSDWAMQNRINDARDQVKRAIDKVDDVLRRLQ